MTLIRGAKGGGGGGKGGGGSQRTPTEAATSLYSTSYAKLVDLISEGEIYGLKDGLKSIYVDNTPLQNADGSYNFKNVDIFIRTGKDSRDQTYIPGFDDVSNEVGVGVTVQKAIPVVRTITDTTVNAARVTISVPSLQKIEDNGDINGASVQLQIAVQYNGGGYSTVIDDTITGRTSQQYQRQYLINLNGAFPIDIKVTRVTEDSGSAKLANDFSWTSYTEVTYAKLSYANSALVGVRINAEQFSSIPSRAYRIRGIKVKIPSNATVDNTTGRLIYSGVWNGTFGAAQWCSDPAMCLWDLLTSTRYGFGNHVDTSQLDRWAFYSASQYCSALVPNGFGGTEPRFSCNVNIQTEEDAYKLINDMCSVFRAMPYWSTGSLTVAQDRPTDAAYLFTYANVSEEGFSYSGSSLKTRPNVVTVQYMDLDLRDKAFEVVENAASIAKYGVIKTQIEAFACTSRGQARRVGEWLLYTANYEATEIVTFTASIEAGVVVRPGQVIKISDPMRAGSRNGGRIKSATTAVVTVDDATGLAVTNMPSLNVVLPDGTAATSTITSINGNAITVSPAFPVAPNANSVWVYANAGLQTTLWRVLGVQEQDQCKYVITALAHNLNKYDYIERDVPLQVRATSNLNNVPAAPTNLSLTEALYTYQAQVRSKIIVSWKGIFGINQYIVKWRKDSGNWTTITRQQPDYEILDTTPGLFEVNVYSLSSGGRSSTTALTGTITALGKTAPPSNVTNFSYSVDSTLGVMLKWDSVPDIDLAQYEIRKGTNWATATLLAQIKGTSFKQGFLDDGSYSYLIKAIDTSGIYSTSATSLSISVVPPNAVTPSFAIQGSNLVLSWSAPAITTYNIASYSISYGDALASSTQLAQTQATSFLVPVAWAGTRKFWITTNDLINVKTAASINVSITAAPAPTVSASFYGRSCTLNWASVAGTLPTAFYEVAYGSTFSGRTVLAKVSADGKAFSTSANWSGARTFYVTALDANGNFGTSGSVVATISTAPAPTVTSAITKGTLTLTWGAVKGTLETAFYEIRQGDTFATATVVGKVTGTSFQTAVTWSGTTRFWVVAVDINGLYGAGG